MQEKAKCFYHYHALVFKKLKEFYIINHPRYCHPFRGCGQNTSGNVIPLGDGGKSPQDNVTPLGDGGYRDKKINHGFT